jgi:hypothetical protein
MLPATAPAGTTSIEPAACSGVGVQSVSASPGAVAPGAEGPRNLLPYTGRHVAGLCDQAIANREAHAAADAHDMVLLEPPFPRACVQYRCIECSRSVDVAHSFGERTPQEHRTGDGSYAPCSGTLLPYAMPKLTHNAVDFSLLPPGVELDLTTISADVAYRVRVEAREQTFTSSSELSYSCGAKPALVLGVANVVEGTWLGAELLAWSGPSMQNTATYQVRVFKIGVNPYTPSDGTQPTMPDKEQLRLEALHAAKESWLQALRTAGLASRARHDAAEAARLQAERDAVAQASRQALLSDLRRAGHVVHVRYLTLAVADQERRAAEAQADAKRLQGLWLRQIAEAAARYQEAICSSAARRAPCCEEAAEQQRSAQEDRRTEPAAGTEVHGQQRLPTPDPNRSTDATVSHQ